MGVDPCTSVAFALHDRPGAYAILVGSGLSTSAGIPTGWQIVEGLITRVAAAEGLEIDGEPADWYARHFGAAPTYSGLVGQLALSSEDRHALIRSFLDLPDGTVAQPTAAHHALARLVRGGQIRVILTTNFDPLLERALAAAGVNPTVLASPDAVAGALPLVHLDCVLIKLHGDQQDPRIKNTEAELDQYEPAVDQLLDHVFDAYGLIIVGWSGDHDTALRAALDRCPTRRFTTYWAHRSPLSAAADGLATRRQAERVPITGADEFLGRLADACQALTDLNRVHPLSIDADVQAAKRELAGSDLAIPLHDRVVAEFERLRAHDLWANPPLNGNGPEIIQRTAAALSELERIAALVAVLVRWGNDQTDRWWWPEIQRFSYAPDRYGELAFVDLIRVPALLVLWSAGITATIAERYDLVARLMDEPVIRKSSDEPDLPAVLAITPTVLHAGHPLVSLFRQLEVAIGQRLGVGDEAFLEGWERWQYLVALRDWDERLTRTSSYVSAGFYPMLRVDARPDRHYEPVVAPWLPQQMSPDNGLHPLLQAGAFGGDPNRLLAARQKFDDWYGQWVRSEDGRTLTGSGGSLPSGRHYPGCFHAEPHQWLQAAGG